MIAAEEAVRAWINSQGGLVGENNPLTNGAFTRSQRSPASGSYAVLARTGGSSGLVAEQDANLAAATVAAMVYGGTQPVAETAAAALMSAIEGLTGSPVPCGSTGVTILVADKQAGPVQVPQPPDAGELYCFTVSAEFTLAEL